MVPTFPRPKPMVLAAIAALVASCAQILPVDLQVPKLYIKDYTLRVRGEAFSDKGKEAMDPALVQIQRFGNVGVFAYSSFTVIADPVLTFVTANNVTLPGGNAVSEPAQSFSDPTAAQESVARKPLFMLDRIHVTYQVPEFQIPEQVIEENQPIKGNSYVTDPLDIAIVKATRTTGRPSIAPGASYDALSASFIGQVTLTADIRDLDPLASPRSFTVSRSLPFMYTQGSIFLSNALDRATGNNIPSTLPTDRGLPAFGSIISRPASPPPSPTPTPSVSPSPAASETPVPGGVGAPVVTPTATPSPTGT